MMYDLHFNFKWMVKSYEIWGSVLNSMNFIVFIPFLNVILNFWTCYCEAKYFLEIIMWSYSGKYRIFNNSLNFCVFNNSIILWPIKIISLFPHNNSYRNSDIGSKHYAILLWVFTINHVNFYQNVAEKWIGKKRKDTDLTDIRISYQHQYLLE